MDAVLACRNATVRFGAVTAYRALAAAAEEMRADARLRATYLGGDDDAGA